MHFLVLVYEDSIAFMFRSWGPDMSLIRATMVHNIVIAQALDCCELVVLQWYRCSIFVRHYT